jgi:sugar/nucleoside kinase (ribokinase family)
MLAAFRPGRNVTANASTARDTNDGPEDRWGTPLAGILPLVDVFLFTEICRMTRCTELDRAVRALASVPPIIAVKRGSRGPRVYAHGKSTDVAPLSTATVDTSAGFPRFLRKLQT